MEAVGAFQLNGFRLGVGGHDGMGRIRTGLSGIGKGRERFVCARKHMVKRQKLTDQARGADRDIAVFGTYKRRDLLGRGLGLLISRLAGARVCASGIKDDGFHMTVGHDLARPLHGSCAEAVRSEHSGSHIQRTVIDHKSQILLTFDCGNTGFHASRGKTLRKRYAHGATPIFVRPASSGSPSATFNDCTACPAVPRLRLSIAAKASKRPALRSMAT